MFATGEPMSANRFVLKHKAIEVDYTIGITLGIPALVYKDGTDVKRFTAIQITTTQTPLGALVSVPLVRKVDTGGENFGFFLPQLSVPRETTEEFATVGIYETFSGPDSVPHRPDSWTSAEFRGTAETVIVPLAQDTAASGKYA
jgi:hypothetical protein